MPFMTRVSAQRHEQHFDALDLVRARFHARPLANKALPAWLSRPLPSPEKKAGRRPLLGVR